MEDNNDLMDIILDGSSPEEVSDKIKQLLYAKSIEKIDSLKPQVALSMFKVDDSDSSEED
jgi:hypothetical protein